MLSYTKLDAEDDGKDKGSEEGSSQEGDSDDELAMDLLDDEEYAAINPDEKMEENIELDKLSPGEFLIRIAYTVDVLHVGNNVSISSLMCF